MKFGIIDLTPGNAPVPEVLSPSGTIRKATDLLEGEAARARANAEGERNAGRRLAAATDYFLFESRKRKADRRVLEEASAEYRQWRIRADARALRPPADRA